MNLREFQHRINAVYGAYVSARQSSEDHDDKIEVMIDDNFNFAGVGDVWLQLEDPDHPILVIASPEAAEEKARRDTEEPPEKESATE